MIVFVLYSIFLTICFNHTSPLAANGMKLLSLSRPIKQEAVQLQTF